MSLLDSKTQEGAYSYLKTFIPHGALDAEPEVPDDEEERAANESKEEGRDRGTDGASGPPRPDGARVQDVRTRMSLREISLSGMTLVQASPEHEALFAGANQISAMELKLLELNLEAFLWGYLMDSSTTTNQAVMWNFGSAEDEAAAITSGGKAKLSKVTRQLTSQRVLIDLNKVQDEAKIRRLGLGKEEKDKMKQDSPVTEDDLLFFYVGPVSTVKSKDSIHLAKIFGLDFYVHPVPTPTALSATMVPAWLCSTTNKANLATVNESFVTVNLVPPLDLADSDSGLTIHNHNDKDSQLSSQL